MLIVPDGGPDRLINVAPHRMIDDCCFDLFLVLAPEWLLWRGSGGGSRGSGIRVHDAMASEPGGNEMQESLVYSHRFFIVVFIFSDHPG